MCVGDCPNQHTQEALQSGEPVAWMSPNKQSLEFSRPETVYGSHTIPLYTTPQPVADDKSDKLAVQLMMIRELLKMCPQDCLGSGQRSDCAPWPIRDEVIDGINKALLSAGKGGEQQ
jgi:hypothetical protein